MFTITIDTTTGPVAVDSDVAGENQFPENVATDLRDRIEKGLPFKVTTDGEVEHVVFGAAQVVQIRVSGTPESSNDD